MEVSTIPGSKEYPCAARPMSAVGSLCLFVLLLAARFCQICFLVLSSHLPVAGLVAITASFLYPLSCRHRSSHYLLSWCGFVTPRIRNIPSFPPSRDTQLPNAQLYTPLSRQPQLSSIERPRSPCLHSSTLDVHFLYCKHSRRKPSHSLFKLVPIYPTRSSAHQTAPKIEKCPQ